jgi:hypothetical protein
MFRGGKMIDNKKEIVEDFEDRKSFLYYRMNYDEREVA